jgi:hypothetical protein
MMTEESLYNIESTEYSTRSGVSLATLIPENMSLRRWRACPKLREGVPKEDLGVVIKNWREALSVSYSARDPRDPRYCENELLHVLAAKYSGPVIMNRNSAYELRWAKVAEISRDSQTDLRKKPIDRKYAPWVHGIFSARITGLELHRKREH